MKRIATVQDISCVGKCSLTVALPVISAMGVEAAIIPTAVLSTHTMFKDFTFCDLTNQIEPITAHWKKEHITFDALYTGYLGSMEQIELMKKFFKEFGDSNTLKIVDPCMADNGKLYPGFTKEFALEMAGLCKEADIIVPNLTEASFLLDIPYVEKGYNEDYVFSILKSLSELGAKRVVLKGIEFDQEQKTMKDTVGKIGIASYDKEKDEFTWYFHEKLSQNYHGTGDIFASVLVGALMRGLSLKDSYSLAGDFVSEAIKETMTNDKEKWYGVDFESVIPYLIKRLEK